MSRTILAIASIIAVSALTACFGSKEETFTAAQVAERVAESSRQAADRTRADEASKTDGKLAAAITELKKIGGDTARQGGFSANANCNVVPSAIGVTQASKDFPRHVTTMYKEACTKEVMAMNAERDRMKATAVAKARLAEKKHLAEAKKPEKSAKRPTTVVKT